MAALDDIRTVEDNKALAQQLFGFVKELTADPQTALHCSLAGGRKTMSAYMALALTLYGRKQDTLSHVLVEEEFESNRQFFFPSRRKTPIAIQRDGELSVVDKKNARIELAEIPFIRLRDVLGHRFTQLDQTVEDTIQLAQYELELAQSQPEPLVVDLERGELRLGASTIRVKGMQLALFAYYAEAKLNHCLRPELAVCGTCMDCFQPFTQFDNDRFLSLYRPAFAGSTLGYTDWKLKKMRGRKPILDADNFRSYLSRLNRRIADAQLPLAIRIIAIGGYGGKRYGVSVDKTRLEIVGQGS